VWFSAPSGSRTNVVGHSLWSTGLREAATRSCSLDRISEGVYARRWRSARAVITPLAATPTTPATPNTFHHRMCLGYENAAHSCEP
jgi:hypothetical protein